MIRKISNAFYFVVIIALLKFSRRIPIRLKRLMTETIALAAYALSIQKRRAMHDVMKVALSGRCDAAQQRRIARGAFHQFWRETFWMAPSAAELSHLSTIPLRGEEHLRSAIARGAGVILLESNLFGSRVLALRVLHAHGYVLHQVHASDHAGSGFGLGPNPDEPPSRWLKSFFKASEMKYVSEIIYLPKSGSLAFTRELLDRLKRNCIVCMAGGGRQSQRLIEVPFLGVERTFSTGIINLARTSGATVLPLICVGRRDDDIEVIVEPAIDISSAPTREENLISGVRQSAGLLERYCRRHPEQFYGWGDLALDMDASHSPTE